MKRVLLFIALACAFAAPASAAPAGQMQAIAFDEVEKTLRPGEPVPGPNDFATVFASVGTAISAHAGEPPYTVIEQYGRIRHFAYMDGRERIDAAGGRSYEISDYDKKLRYEVDPASRTYTQSAIAEDGHMYSTRNGRVVPGALAAGQTGVMPTLKWSDKPLSATIDGIAAQGEQVQLDADVSGGSCASAHMEQHMTFLADPTLTEPEFNGQFYAAHLMMLGNMLSTVAGCSVAQPDTAAHFEKAAGLLLYRESDPAVIAGTRQVTSLGMLMMRGNLRHLTSADASLFQVPAGYRLVAAK